MSMKIIVTGSRGMLGTDLLNVLHARQHQPIECDLHNCDILNLAQLDAFVAAQRPAVIIHAAAYTNVDQAGFHWCADDAITQWDPGTYETAGDFVIRDFDVEITAVCPFADRLVVAGQSRLYTVSFIGAPYFFSTLPMLFG